jgi:hypothetical protein
MAAISGWTFRGTALNSGNIKITDVSGLFGLPPLRGDDWLTYGHTGRLFVPKVHDSRHIMLKIEVLDQPLNSAQALFASLSTLFANRAQGALVYTDYAAATYTAQAECYSWTPAIQTKPALVWEGIADFLLADPWLYGATVSSTTLTPVAAAVIGRTVTSPCSSRSTVPFVFTGVVSGQPIVVWTQGSTGTISSIADTFGGHYTWTAIESTAAPSYMCLWIGTGGTGTSGTVTVTWSGAAYLVGQAWSLVGGSTSAGAGAVDAHGNHHTASGGYEQLSLTPTAASECAIYACQAGDGWLTSTPYSPPWVSTAFYTGPYLEWYTESYQMPPSAVALTATWNSSLPNDELSAVGLIVKAAASTAAAIAVSNSGTAVAEHVLLDILGPIVSPSILNTTNGTAVALSGVTVAPTKHLLIDCWTMTATNDGVNVIGSVTHSGALTFLTLTPGVNDLSVVGGGSDANTSVTVRFTPPYE